MLEYDEVVQLIDKQENRNIVIIYGLYAHLDCTNIVHKSSIYSLNIRSICRGGVLIMQPCT